MTLSDLANLGEFIGGIAVIVTLIYLAVQLKQNSKMARANAVATLLARYESPNAILAGSTEAAWARHLTTHRRRGPSFSIQRDTQSRFNEKLEEQSMDISFLDQVKIQSRVLIPIVKALRKEMGEEKANSFVKNVLGNLYREYGAAYWKAQQADSPNEKITTLWEMFAGANALDYDVVENNSERCDLNIKRCGYAVFFHKLGEPELGFLLCCSNDIPMTEGFGGGVNLDVKQTIMQGASHCEFRYQIDKEN